MKFTCKYMSPIGKILISADDVGITSICFDGQNNHKVYTIEEKKNLLLIKALEWLDIYFSGGNPGFKLPLHFTGSEFQNKVWKILETISYGETMTYGEIANMLAKETGISHMSAQAVGQAINRNPILIMVPCHRVIGKDGSLTGYSGGLEKKYLLKLEKLR